MEIYLISMGITIVLNLLKDATARRKYKNALLKISRAIAEAFPAEIAEKEAWR